VLKSKTDPFRASLECVADILADLQDLDYEYRVINNFRSAISAFHLEIGETKVEQASLIKHLMIRIRILKLSLLRYNKTWDVDQVIK
jgi:hypothetical protein